MQTQTSTERKLWIGIDFHKKTWRVHMRTDLFSGNPFSMKPDPLGLKKKIDKEYSKYQVEVVYECGCFGLTDCLRVLAERVWSLIHQIYPEEQNIIFKRLIL